MFFSQVGWFQRKGKGGSIKQFGWFGDFYLQSYARIGVILLKSVKTTSLRSGKYLLPAEHLTDFWWIIDLRLVTPITPQSYYYVVLIFNSNC